MLKARLITAAILLVLLLTALFALPKSVWAVLVVLMVMQGAHEWQRLSGFDRVSGYFYLGLTLLLIAVLLFVESGGALAVYGVSALLWLVIVPCWLAKGWKLRNPLLLALAGWAVLLPTGLAMQELRAVSPWMLLSVMGLVWVADSTAYFAGRKFGKNKLAPSISPGKTWEGVAGALLGVGFYVSLLWIYKGASLGIGLPMLLVAGWLWVGLAVIGDLFESLIKRQAGAKDSGALLPGHGGLLDRIDALTSTLPLAAMVLLLQHWG